MLKADFFSLPANEMLSNTNSTQENTLNKGPSNFSRTSYILPEPELTMNKAFAQKWNTIIGNKKKMPKKFGTEYLGDINNYEDFQNYVE